MYYEYNPKFRPKYCFYGTDYKIFLRGEVLGFFGRDILRLKINIDL